MALHHFETEFYCVSHQNSLRPSFGYRHFFDMQKSKVFSSISDIKLKYILNEVPATKLRKGELNESEILVDLANIERRFNNLIDLPEVNQIGSDKNILQDGDIVIPKMQPQMGNIFLNIENKRYVGSTELLEYKINENWNPIFLYYLMTLPKFLTDLGRLENGKTHRRVNSSDLLEIKIPNIPKQKQDEIVEQVEPIVQKIKSLKAQIIPAQNIINQVFEKVFGFDYQAFEKLKTIKSFNLDVSEFASNIDLRQSVKFHREAAKFVLNELKKHTTKKIKHFISEPIVLGKGISPAEYDDNGDYIYIAMSNIKNWQFEMNEARGVTSTFANNNQNKKVAINDILIARSGEGTIGKVALIEDEDLQGIFADFTMRIRLKNYDSRFAYYYFRTSYFQYLIEINKKGLGNNTNIFPSQIQELPLLDISLGQQQVIVDEIQLALNEQNLHKFVIDAKRLEIDNIVEASI